MIRIDIPMPGRCEECPCSYFIRTGPHEGEMMCEAMEVNGYTAEDSILEYWAAGRPENCPIQKEAET